MCVEVNADTDSVGASVSIAPGVDTMTAFFQGNVDFLRNQKLGIVIKGLERGGDLRGK